MSFFNSVKILLSRFGYVWRVALYLLIAIVIIGGVGTAILIPVGIEIFDSEGFMLQYTALTEVMRYGGGLYDLFVGVRELGGYFFEAVSSSVGSIISLAAFLVLVVGVLSRYLLGLYEIPLGEVMDSSLSSNAKISFVGRIIASMSKSSRFVLYKAVVLLIYDIIMVMAVFGVLNLLLVPYIRFLAPFFAMIVLVAMLAFRSTLVAAWAPLIVVDKMPPRKAFGQSIKAGFRGFGRLYSNYLVIWTIIIALNYIAAVYTFGAGLILTIPITTVFVKIFNMVYFYNKTNRRYYVLGRVFSPSGEKIE